MARGSSTVRIGFLGDASQLAREAHKAQGSLDGVGKHAQRSSKLVGAALGGAALAGVAALGLGIKKFTSGAQDSFKNAVGDALKLQRTLGGTLEQTSALAFAASKSGIDMDTLARSFQFFSKSLGADGPTMLRISKAQAALTEARGKDAKTAKEQISKQNAVTRAMTRLQEAQGNLGVSIVDANGKARGQMDVLTDVAEQFKNMENGPNKTALAMKLFGRAGSAMIPLLNKGKSGMAELAAEAEQLGVIISNDDAAGVKEYVASQRTLQASTRSLKIAFGRELFPVLTEWTKLLSANMPAIRDMSRAVLPQVREAVAKLADKLREAATPGSDFRTAMQEIMNTLRDLLPVVQTAFEQLSALIGWMTEHETAVKRFGIAVGTYAGYMRAAAIATAAMAIISPAAAAAPVAAAGAAAGTASVGFGLAAGALWGGAGLIAGLAALEAYSLWTGSKITEGSGTKTHMGYGEENKYAPPAPEQPGTFDPRFKNPNAPAPKPKAAPRKNPYKPATQADAAATKRYRQAADPVAANVAAKAKATAAAVAGASAVTSKAAAGAAKATTSAAKSTEAATKKTAAAEKKKTDAEKKHTAALERIAAAKERAAEALRAATEKVRDALTERQDSAKSIRDNIVGSSSVLQDGLSWSAKDLLSSFREKMTKVKRFQAAIQSMVSKGFSASIIRQVAEAGVDGGMATAVGLAHASGAQVKQFNGVQAGIEKSAGITGDRAAHGMYAPIHLTTQVVLNDKVLATAVNKWNATAGRNGSTLARTA